MKCKPCLVATVTLVFLAVVGSFLILTDHLSFPKKEGHTLPADPAAHIASKADRIRITTPEPGAMIESPLSITGEARGYWFFEASFPVILSDWDGRIIAEYHATAEDEWMTEDFVPFESTLTFEKPFSDDENVPDFMRRGTLILKKDNPSGLPEHDDALEIPVVFK